MSYLDDDDDVSNLERFLRQTGSPSNYVQPDMVPQIPSTSPVIPKDLGMEMATNPPEAEPKRLPFSAVPPNAYDIPAPKVASSPGTGDQQTIKDLGQSVFDHAPIPTPPAFTGAAPGGGSSNLYAAQAKYGTPIDPHDPKYHMGIGQRLLATVANFSNGFAKNGREPIYVGSGATNHRYDQDEAVRRGNLENTQTQIKSAQELAEENRKQYNTAAQSQERAAIGRGREDTGKAALQNADTNETKAANAKKIADEKLAEQHRKNDQIAEWRKDPKNYTQLAVAARTETDPETKAQLESALQDVVKLEMKKHPGKAGGKPGTPGWVNGLTKEENAEAKITAEMIGKQMVTERSKLISFSTTPKEKADAQANLDALRERANSIVPGIVNRRTTQPPAPGGARTAPPKTPNLTPIPDKQMTTPKGNTIKIGDKHPLTGQVVKGFARDASGTIHVTF